MVLRKMQITGKIKPNTFHIKIVDVQRDIDYSATYNLFSIFNIC
jgi:hypothetical protein